MKSRPVFSFVQKVSSRSPRAIMPKLPPRVTITEVGPRDGLQSEAYVSTEDKLHYIQLLEKAHKGAIEAGSFVSPKLVPQFSDAEPLAKKLQGEHTWLVFNVKGLEQAIALGVKSVAIVDTPSEEFAKNNMGADNLMKVFERNEAIISRAQKHGVSVDLYLSTCFHEPSGGIIRPTQVQTLIYEYLGFSPIHKITISDTTGRATPPMVSGLLQGMGFGDKEKAVHFHDTFGTALGNVLAAVECGVEQIDSAAGGLGGCNFAKGATGNVATEDIVYSLESMGVKTGVDLHGVIQASTFMAGVLGKIPVSSVYNALKEKSPEEITSLLDEQRAYHRELRNRDQANIAI